MPASPKVAVIGLDCAEPSLMFDRWLDDLPNLKGLVESGMWGRLRSVDPPITVPAWSCMTSGRDPGELGFYGFRNRRDYSYDNLWTADSRAVTVERLWDRFGEAGRHSIVQGVPQTYPVSPIEGELIADFLTPDPRKDQYTHPPELRDEIERIAPSYQVDVRNFRSDDRDRILAEVYEMTEQHFAVSRHLLDTRPWEFFMSVEIGLDRLHHAFWRYEEEARHPRFEAGHRYNGVIKAYYQYLDDEIGELLERFDDDTIVLVVSDHGARPMEGAICVNEWLVQEGYLVLNTPPAPGTRIQDADIDWSRTRAWGEGGYYCRLFLNVEGREPQGIVAEGEYEALRAELIDRLEALGGPDGPIGTKAHKPEDLWAQRNGITPDLVVYFGDLAWRSNGTLGHGRHYTFDNDTGPDDANHAQHGLLIMAGPGVEPGHREDLSILDVTPTVLDLAGLPAPDDLQGRIVSKASPVG